MKSSSLNVVIPLPFAATLPMLMEASTRQNPAAVDDHVFIALLTAYRTAGGIARQDELLRRMETTRRLTTRRSSDLPDVDGAVTFMWNGIAWWPLFQFDADMRVRPQVARIAHELAGVFTSWELALWFVTPNDWLGDQLPIACVSRHGDETLQSARADRFIAVG
jgi:hypothetical protein